MGYPRNRFQGEKDPPNKKPNVDGVENKCAKKFLGAGE